MPDSQRSNTLGERLENDEVALGVLDSTYSPTLVELYGDLGLDFVWIDLEHGGPSPWDAGALENLLRAAEVTDTELLVRVPTSQPEGIRKALDAGVRNVFLARAEGAAEVRQAVEAARFRYEDEPGKRGLAAPRARRWGMADEYVATEDAETMVGVTVETRETLAELDEILAIDGLGFVFIGPLDLSVQLGHPGELDHPEVREAVETVRSKAIDAGVPVGGLGFGMDDVNEKVEQGYRMLNLGSTTGALQAAVGDWLDAFEGDRP
ncbi:2-dehydro-3-deoxyglucarate aldolase [Halorientalis persicus]|jgi:2-dehydro-3-deoxyglucarate aldolase|uniref:2-dehydro-3-deoxyglucarate aldolase n=1 Tax=Halorientalis persicus TaxID=1367881 RepID=A0A1H8TPQ9_9EURY|nr:aldolase/citrate lyase family protein [Halorientalis persicus]SEO93019.1 2-dehydro-3-deoxyglucarate aldolase [Halorientalis persicus]